MKTLRFFLPLFMFLAPHTSAQFESFGLDGRVVFDIRLYGGRVYAATDNGAYVRAIFGLDKGWEHIGLTGLRVRSIYPHSFGPIGYAVTAGIERVPGDTLSPLTFCTENADTNWFASDDGIGRQTIGGVQTLDGFPSPVICGETYAGGWGKLFRRTTGPYENVLDIGLGVTNAVRTDARTRRVWVGGENASLSPFICLSEDLGTTWHHVFPDLGGDNACNVIADDLLDTSVVYAGMEGAVMKSTDGGRAWRVTGLRNTRFYIYGLTQTYLGRLFAAGAASVGSPAFALFVSDDNGETWKELPSAQTWKGFRCAVMIPTALPEENWLLVGTLGDGVLRCRVSPISGISRPPSPATPVYIYPTPADDRVYLHFGFPVAVDRRILVHAIDGRLVAEHMVHRGMQDATLSTVGWPPGVYSFSVAGSGQHQEGTILIAR